MNDLQKKIKQVEADIFLENLYIQEQYHSLTQHTNAPKFLSISLLSTFIFGFVISRKKSVPQVIARLASLGFAAKKWYLKIKNFLPLLPL